MKTRAKFLLAMLCLIIVSAVLENAIRSGSYGIKPKQVVFVFLAAEILFNLSIVCLLWFAGVRKISWKEVKSWDLTKPTNFKPNLGVCISLVVNRLVWTMPFGYILLVGWQRLPWSLRLACALEIGVTLWIGFLGYWLIAKGKPES